MSSRDPDRHNTPFVDDRDVLAHILDQIELMAREHDRHTFGSQFAQRPGKGLDTDGIEAGERLIEDQEFGIRGQSRGELHALLVAVGEILELRAASVRQAERR